MSQSEQILSYLRTGAGITAYEALERFRCLRLAARVDELRRAGHPIRVERLRLGRGKVVALYSLDAR